MITDNSIKDTPFRYDALVWKTPLFFVFTIWFVYWIEYMFHYNFSSYGIYPRNVEGLRGIFFSPFLHGSAKHLMNNTFPVFVLMAALMFFYRKVAWQILIYGTLLSGLMTWVIARDAYHIGASGLIYVLASFIFFSGIFRKSLRLVAISLAVAFWYGGMIWYVLPIVPEMSWEGHLSGLITGLLLAYFYRNKGLRKQPYPFVQTEFDTYFDADGNFSPPVVEESMEDQENKPLL